MAQSLRNPCLGLSARARICGFCRGRLRVLAQRTTWPGAIQPSLHVPRPPWRPLPSAKPILIPDPHLNKSNLRPERLLHGSWGLPAQNPSSLAQTAQPAESHQSQLHPRKSACRTGDHMASRSLLGRPSPLSVLFLYDMLNACMTLVFFVPPPGGPPPPPLLHI